MLTSNQVISILKDKGFGIVAFERDLKTIPNKEKALICTLDTMQIDAENLYEKQLCIKFIVTHNMANPSEIYSGNNMSDAIRVYNHF